MITYQINGRPCAEDVRELTVSVGWSDPARHGLEVVQRVWDMAPCTVLAYDGERMVGMCRAMWDGGILAEIRNVVVLPEYQGQGIGTQLVTQLVAELAKLGVAHMTLVTGHGNEGFYQRFGFAVRPVTAMIRSREAGTAESTTRSFVAHDAPQDDKAEGDAPQDDRLQGGGRGELGGSPPRAGQCDDLQPNEPEEEQPCCSS